MPIMKMLNYSPVHQLVAYISVLLLLVLTVAACGSPSSTGGPGTPTPGRTVSPGRTATTEPTTVPMPPTQTSCPPAGTARGAVMAPLMLGSHANVVYLQNQWEGSNPLSQTLLYKQTVKLL